MKLAAKLILLIGIGTLSACSTQKSHSLYYWGDYADNLYAYYNEPQTLAKQELALQALIQNAQSSGKAVAPGIYAHLGLIAMKQGKKAEANEAFQQEKIRYPESATFIQYLQSKLN